MALARANRSMSLGEEVMDEKRRKKKERAAKGQKKVPGVAAGPSGAGGVPEGGITSLAKGALKGGAAGPVGMGIGVVGDLVSANQAKKAAERAAPPRPKRRRVKRVLDEADRQKRNKEQAMATLSQAVMDWASSIR